MVDPGSDLNPWLYPALLASTTLLGSNADELDLDLDLEEAEVHEDHELVLRTNVPSDNRIQPVLSWTDASVEVHEDSRTHVPFDDSSQPESVLRTSVVQDS